MNFPFIRPFIQCILNTDTVPDFVREASMLAPGSSRFCFPACALSLFNYFSAAYAPQIWAASKGTGLQEPLGQGSKKMNKTKSPYSLENVPHDARGEGAALPAGRGKHSLEGNRTGGHLFSWWLWEVL